MSKSVQFGKSLRADAAWVVFQVLENRKSTRELLPLVQRKYAQPKDINWLNQVVLGVLRSLPILQLWLRPKLKKPLKGSKKIVEHLLLVGFYQLYYMRVSDHAAINETVNACNLFHSTGLKGLVNAILRDFQRNPPSLPQDDYISSGLPKWLFNSITGFYPDNAKSIIQNMNEEAPTWLRINHRKISLKDYCNLLDESRVKYEISNELPNAIIVNGIGITQLPGFEKGLFTVQDGAAQKAALLLAPKSNDYILDCCAAPGGKTCHLYDLAPDAHILAIDSDKKRLTRVTENLTRLDCQVTLKQGDASEPDTWWDGTLFDRILVDAPCSATGVIRRHPDIRWLRKPEDIQSLVELQAKILQTVWSLLKPGGILLYATCSILPSENSKQIDAFLAKTQDAKRDADDIQILPGEKQMDGFYYARLLKSKV